MPPQSPDDFVGRLERVLRVHRGRRDGEPETRIELDHLMPPPNGGRDHPARWRLATSAARLYPPPAPSAPMKAWHTAEGHKGRRLLAGDLRQDNRVAAILAWHYQPQSSSAPRRPHLITAAAIRKDVDPAVRAEYLVAFWLLVCVMAAIDRRTIQTGRVGLVLDSGIDLSSGELARLGFKPGRKREGYRGDYYTRPS